MRQNKYTVILTEDERAFLRTLVGHGVAPARDLTHARILLKADQGEAGPGWTDAAIAAALDLHWSTVARVRRSFVERGLAAALTRKTPLRTYPRTLDGTAEAQLVAMVCGAPPPGHSQWSLRLLANQLVERQIVETVSHETVRQTLKQTPLNPG